MSTRRGLLTPTHCIRIQTFDEVLNMPMLVDALPRLNTLDLFYSSMLQAGIDKIDLIPFTEKDRTSPSPFVQKHLSFRSGKEWAEAFFTVHKFFTDHHPFYAIGGKGHDDEVSNLFAFLVDLLAALSSHRNLLHTSKVPDPNELVGKLPPEILLPITNLLNTFEKVGPSLLSPRMTIDQDNVVLFQEMIASQRFSEYKTTHSAFEDPAVPTTVSSRQVSEATRLICSRNRRWVKGRKIIVSVLPFSARIVDMIFGALPGKLAEQFSRMTEEWLTRNQRMVVYELDGISKQLIQGRINEYSKVMVSSSNSEISDGQ
jgi:hypothetical protein